MDARGSTQVINDEAARWVARIDSRPLDGAATAELGAWLARDDRHRGAFFRALAIWQALNEDENLDATVADLLDGDPVYVVPPVPVAAMDEEAADPPVAAPFSRRRLLWAGAAFAASIAPLAFLTGILSLGTGSETRRIDTALGELTRVPLKDGSLVILNTASRLEVTQSDALRSIRLDEGEAWFKVARDARRPFVVTAGDIRVRALGTAFSVRRRDDGADVQVTEGTVEVWSEANAARRLEVSAGARTFVNEQIGALGVVDDAAAINRELSWREGVLQFEGKTLRQAADEFNRYNTTKLQIDPALADEKVIGRFNTTEPDTFAQAISTAFGAKVQTGAGWIHIEKN